MEITGDTQVAAAITRMVGAHASVLDAMSDFRASASAISRGVRLTVTSRVAEDSSVTNRIRGLGFIGLMAQGDHHTVHHLMLARGAGAHAHGGGENAAAHDSDAGALPRGVEVRRHETP